MKNLAYIMLLALVVSSCTRKVVIGEEVATVQDSKVNTEGVLYVKSWVRTNCPKHAQQDALKNAIEKVLFSGVPGSKVKRPLIVNSTIRNAHSDFFQNFFADEGMYKMFGQPLRIKAKDRIKQSGKDCRIGVECKVFYKQLRDELVARGIIEKFGI